MAHGFPLKLRITFQHAAYNFSHTLPSNAGSGAVISARNTSIPHPLPHQLGEKSVLTHQKSSAANLGGNSALPPAALPHSGQSNCNTLPMRSPTATALAANAASQQLSQLQYPAPKHANPCQNVKTLPFGFGIASGGVKPQPDSRPPKDMQDLIHLPGPLTEHAVMHTLQARFNDQRYFVSVLRTFRLSFLLFNITRLQLASLLHLSPTSLAPPPRSLLEPGHERERTVVSRIQRNYSNSLSLN